MSRIVLFVCLAVAVALFAGAGYLEAQFSNRFGERPNLKAAGKTLVELPHDFGKWEMVESEPLDEDAARILECAGSFHRVYQHTETGQQVRVAMIVGPGGPTAVHVPEICYSSQTYDQLGAGYDLPVKIGDQEHQFRGVEFQSKDLLGAKLDVCYAWSSDGVWQAPTYRRLTLAGEPVLYKIQLACMKNSFSSSEEQEDLRVAFLRDFVPFINQNALGRVAKP